MSEPAEPETPPEYAEAMSDVQRIDDMASALRPLAAERANELVLQEGIPFREAYRRVAAELAGKTGSND